MIRPRQTFMFFLAASLTIGSASYVASPAWAQAGAQPKSWAQRHPRRAEVLGRDRNLGNNVYRDRGNLNGQYGQLMQQDRSIRQQEQADARANGGYLTQQQKAQFNQQENQLRNQIGQDYNGPGQAVSGAGGQWVQQHPRQAEVLGRDSNLGNNIRRDAGDLGGNYNQLMSTDKSIHQQERSDAQANGGYITPQQTTQLNQEESQLRNQINQDFTGK